MACLRLVAVFVGVLCYLCVASGEDAEAKPLESVKENEEVEESSDLETAETKDLLFFAKKKVGELLFHKKKLGYDSNPSYRQYYNTYPNYGYQNSNNDKFSNYIQTILDCFKNGESYAPSSGYRGSVPIKSYFYGGKPVSSSYAGNQVSYDSYPGSKGGYFGASISGSASLGGSTSDNSASSNGGFNPSYYSYTTYDSPTAFGNHGNRQNSYSSANYPGNSPTSYYYYSNTSPQAQQPQYFQNTAPIQQPLSHTPISYNSQGFVYVSTPSSNDVDTSSQTPPPFAINVIVPPGSESPVASQQGNNNYGVNPPSQSPITITPQEIPPSVPITPRPQYHTQSPVITGNGPSVYSVYSSDSYLSRPYYYSSYGYPYGLGEVSKANPPKSYSYNGFYSVPSSPNIGYGFSSNYNGNLGYPGNGNSYQFAAYPGSGVSVTGGNKQGVVPGADVVFPTANAPVNPATDCN